MQGRVMCGLVKASATKPECFSVRHVNVLMCYVVVYVCICVVSKPNPVLTWQFYCFHGHKYHSHLLLDFCKFYQKISKQKELQKPSGSVSMCYDDLVSCFRERL